MKQSTVFAKLFPVKAKVLGTLGGLAIALVALGSAAPAANAQVAFGIAVGGPRYYAPVPVPQPVYRPYGYGPGYVAYGRADEGYWAHRRDEGWRERQAWREHESRERQRDWREDRDFGYRQ